MERLTSPATMRAWSDEQRRRGRRLAMVPTMGALHDGHLHLIEVARQHGDEVVVSVFVNSLQFNRRDDFDAYPRPIDDDADACAAAGVGALYVPTAAAMYPEGFETHVEPGRLAEPMEGAGRPGHFRGVTTVVAKLLNAAVPHVAVFGRKDYQQLAIVRQMVADLDMGVEIIGVPTVREADGLALSSRNRRLTPAQRAAAICIPRGLTAARELHAAGEHDATTLRAAVESRITAEPLARLEYVELVHPTTLQALDHATHAVIAVAVWFGDVRLIDNVEMTS
ncbi:MAG: pantoate--beta-alanine ligase [Acidimicrobiia bacterium]